MDDDNDSKSGEATNTMTQMPTMMFAPPAITAALLPRPDTPQKQSAEEWFRVFRAVAENLIAIYKSAGQEVVGQRQALAAIPSLLNRTEGETRLSIRILSECQNLDEAGDLISQTVGDLETECQAAESIFNLRRGEMALEDFYALLVEKDRKARLGRTTIIKKFIAELPEGIKTATQKQFKKIRGNLELTKDEVDRIYASARQFYQEKYGNKAPPTLPHKEPELVLPVCDDVPDAQGQADDTISKMLDEKLDAYFAERERNQKARQPPSSGQRQPPSSGQWGAVICHFCKKRGHVQRDCWLKKGTYCTLGSNSAVMVQGRLNNTKTSMMVDSGAGPCVIDLPTLQKIKPEAKIEPTKKSLHGIGTTDVVGTAKLDVALHTDVNVSQQMFHVVSKLGVVLLGRSLLKKFDSLEISWRCMELKIDGHTIPGSKVINGGEVDSRLFVAQEKTTTTDITDRINEEIEQNDTLDSTNKERLRDLLYRFQDRFIEDPKKPPRTHLVEHVIDTTNAQPTRDKLRRLPPSWREEIAKQIDEMLANGICRPSNSPWSSQVLLTKKKDQTMRFVIDYRRLNDVSCRDQYPMPNIRDLMDDLQGAKLFSCMDLPSAYWHVPMDESSIAKTAFEVPGGKYEMLRMPFGLKNSQSTQQRLMDQVLGKIPKTSTYVDNILTHSVTPSEHFRNLEAILTQLRESNLSLRLDKCEFMRQRVEQFGFVVDKNGLRPTGDGVRKINMYPTPTNVKEVKRFLGMANYYREFVPKFSEIAEPIHQVLRDGVSFSWT